MHKSQANRAVIARRAPGASTSTEPVSRNMALRVEVTRPAAGAIRNRKAPKMTSTQRNSQGRRSEWNLSPYSPRGGWR